MDIAILSLKEIEKIIIATQDVIRKWTGRIQNWGQILLQLSIFFPDKVKPHLP